MCGLARAAFGLPHAKKKGPKPRGLNLACGNVVQVGECKDACGVKDGGVVGSLLDKARARRAELGGVKRGVEVGDLLGVCAALLKVARERMFCFSRHGAQQAQGVVKLGLQAVFVRLRDDVRRVQIQHRYHSFLPLAGTDRRPPQVKGKGCPARCPRRAGHPAAAQPSKTLDQGGILGVLARAALRET